MILVNMKFLSFQCDHADKIPSLTYGKFYNYKNINATIFSYVNLL